MPKELINFVFEVILKKNEMDISFHVFFVTFHINFLVFTESMNSFGMFVTITLVVTTGGSVPCNFLFSL